MRCRAEPRRKGIPARRDLVGYRHPRGVRPGRRQPAHVYRPGNGDVLERLRRQHADARQRYVLRSARRRQEKFPVAVKNKLGNTRPRAKHNTSAKLAALHFYQLALPAPKAPEDTYDKQRAACGVRRRGVRRQSGLRALPRATALYRAGLVDAHGEGDRHRRLPGKAVASSCLSASRWRPPFRRTSTSSRARPARRTRRRVLVAFRSCRGSPRRRRNEPYTTFPMAHGEEA